MDGRGGDWLVSRGEASSLGSPPRGTWRRDRLGVDGLMSREGSSILGSLPRGPWRVWDGFVSRVKGSVLGSPPRGPWRVGGLGGDGLLSRGEGSMLLSTPRCSELRGSGRGCFGGSEKGVVFSGFLDGSWAGHKLSVVFDNSLRNSGRIGLGDEGPGVVGGCREGSGQDHTVWAFSGFFKRLS